MFLSFSLLTLGITTGVPAMNIYVTEIFAQTGSVLPEKSASIIISLITIAANMLFSSLVDRVNRRVIICVTLTFKIKRKTFIFFLPNYSFEDCSSVFGSVNRIQLFYV